MRSFIRWQGIRVTSSWVDGPSYPIRSGGKRNGGPKENDLSFDDVVRAYEEIFDDHERDDDRVPHYEDVLPV